MKYCFFYKLNKWFDTFVSFSRSIENVFFSLYTKLIHKIYKVFTTWRSTAFFYLSDISNREKYEKYFVQSIDSKKLSQNNTKKFSRTTVWKLTVPIYMKKELIFINPLTKSLTSNIIQSKTTSKKNQGRHRTIFYNLSTTKSPRPYHHLWEVAFRTLLHYLGTKRTECGTGREI